MRHKFYFSIKAIFLVLSLVFIAAPTWAQFQRIGVFMGEELMIGAEDVLGILPSVCTDLDYDPPREGMQYNLTTPDAIKVYVGESTTPMSFQKAVDQKIITYDISDFSGITIEKGINGSGKEIRIKTISDALFDTPENADLSPSPSHFDYSSNTNINNILSEYKKIFEEDQALKQSIAWNRDPNAAKEKLYKELQSDVSEEGLYNGPIDGSFEHTREALQNFNHQFNISTNQLWGKIQERILDDLDQISLFYQSSSKNIGYTNKYSSLIYAGQDGQGFDQFITTDRFFHDKNFKGATYTCKSVPGASFRSGPQRSNATGEVTTLFQNNFSKQVSKLNSQNFPTLYVSSINADNKATITFNGTSGIVTLNPSDLYQSLLDNIRTRLKETTVNSYLLSLDYLQKDGIGDALYDQEIIKSNDGISHVNTSRLASDLNKENTVFIGTDPKNDLTRYRRLATFSDEGKKNTLLIFDPVMSGSGPSPAMLRQYQDKGLNVIQFNNLDDIKKAKIDYGDGLLITVGHNDTKYQNYIKQLGYNLNGKILVSYSCKVPGDIAFYSELINDYGLKLVIHFPDEIMPEAVNAVFQKLGSRLKNLSKLEDLQRVWSEAADDAIKDPRFKDIIDEIRKLGRPEFQLSELNKVKDDFEFSIYG